ncbi:MAG: V-type ATP synthase subunit E [Candidatus Ratteibacteria bacterium]
MNQKPDKKDINGLVSEIEKVTRSQVDEIIKQASAEAEKLVNDAMQKAQNLLNLEKQKTEQLISTMKQRGDAATKMELKKMRLQLKKEFANHVIEKVKEMALSFRNSAEYQSFLKKAVLEGIEVVGTPEVIIKFSPLDVHYFNADFEKEILETCIKDLKKTVSIQFVQDNFQDTGIIACSSDGFIMYDNTFSARLQRAYDSIYSEILGEEI